MAYPLKLDHAARHRLPSGIPTFSGDDARRKLTRRWGLPNTAARHDAGDWWIAGPTRLLFVDDDLDGLPVAYWTPTLSAREIRRRLAAKAVTL